MNKQNRILSVRISGPESLEEAPRFHLGEGGASAQFGGQCALIDMCAFGQCGYIKHWIKPAQSIQGLFCGWRGEIVTIRCERFDSGIEGLLDFFDGFFESISIGDDVRECGGSSDEAIVFMTPSYRDAVSVFRGVHVFEDFSLLMAADEEGFEPLGLRDKLTHFFHVDGFHLWAFLGKADHGAFIIDINVMGTVYAIEAPAGIREHFGKLFEGEIFIVIAIEDFGQALFSLCHSVLKNAQNFVQVKALAQNFVRFLEGRWV